MKKRLCLVLSSAVIIGLLASATAMGASQVPKWLVTRVHALVVSDDNQNQQIASLQSSVQDLQSRLTTVEAQLSAADSQLACFRTLTVSRARVISATHHQRYVLRVPSAPGRAPFASLVRTVC